MACYHPITAWQSQQAGLKTRPLHFTKTPGYKEIRIPCGQCIGCRLEKSRQWAIRCLFEASLHDENSFITLTFDNEHMPSDHSLHKEHMTLFMKKLRNQISEASKKMRIINKTVHYYLCGEYGEECQQCHLSKNYCTCNTGLPDPKYGSCNRYLPGLGRPHYHICLFNHDFKDKTLLHSGQFPLYRSAELERIWPYGFSSIGELNFETAAYVARYCTKKMSGGLSGMHYGGKLPEFSRMSLRPAIGKEWYRRYSGDVTGPDKIIIRNGLTCKPPRYYDKLTGIDDPEMLERIKTKRMSEINLAEETGSRLRVREDVANHKFNKKQRTYENG